MNSQQLRIASATVSGAVIAVLTALSLCLMLALFALPASAHNGEDERLSASSHAEADAIDPASVEKLRGTAGAEDLAAARERQATGFLTTLGARSITPATAPNPHTVGQWTAPFATNSTLALAEQASPGIVPVFTAVLPNGKVLAWDYQQAGGPAIHNGTRVMLYDPETNSSVRKDLTDAVVGTSQAKNLFCAGYAQLPNGDLLVVGGNKNLNSDPINTTFIFHWQSETWERGPDMARDRWYPSVTTMANGEALIVGGDPLDVPGDAHGEDTEAFPEVFQLDGTYRSLTNLTHVTSDPQTLPSTRYYPFLDPAQDGRVLYAGMEPNMQMIDARGAGSKSYLGVRDTTNRTYGSFVHYDRGRLLVNGGGSMVPHLGATNTGSKVSLTRDGGEAASPPQGMPSSSAIANMAFDRRMHYLTVLPTGEVLATGGKSKNDEADYLDNNNWDGKDLVDLARPVKTAEIWNPDSNSWTTLAAAQKIREYHSFATLLPDGRVLTGGGGTCGACDVYGYQEPNFEIFSPPYLFNSDGSPATRPTITAAPSGDVDFTSSFTVTTPDAASINKVALIRLGAATHSVDQGQRRVPLDFTAGAGELTVRAPANAFEAPPGFYMLFIVNNNGTPSKAKIVQLGTSLSQSGETHAATAYAAAGLSGESQDFGYGKFTAEQGHLAQVGNNAIRSLRVGAGFEVLICTGTGQTGSCNRYAAGDHPALPPSLSATTSSLVVCDAGECPAGNYTGEPPSPPAKPSPPTIKLGRTLKLAAKVSFPAVCAGGCKATGVLTAKSKKLSTVSRAAKASARSQQITFTFTKKHLKAVKTALRRKQKVTLSVTLTDAAGQSTKATAKVIKVK